MQTSSAQVHFSGAVGVRTWFPENGRSGAAQIALSVFDQVNREFANCEEPQPKVLSITLNDKDVRRTCEVEVELAKDVVILVRYGATDDDEEEVWHNDPEQHDVAEIVYLVLYWTVALKPKELRGLSARLRAARSRLEKALFDWSTLGCPLELFDIRPIGTRLHYGGNRIEVMVRFWTLDNELQRGVAELEVNDFPELTGHRFEIEADKAGERQKTKSFLESHGAHGSIDQLAVNMIALHHDVGEVMRSGNLNAYPASKDSIYLCEDGHVSCIGSSPSSPPVSWYDNVVHVEGITLPEATLVSLPGRPITNVVRHRVLSSNMIVTRAYVETDWPKPMLVIEFEQPRLLFCRHTGRVWEEPS